MGVDSFYVVREKPWEIQNMQKIVAVSDTALALSAQLLDNEIRKGLIVGMTIALFFIWGP